MINWVQSTTFFSAATLQIIAYMERSRTENHAKVENMFFAAALLMIISGILAIGSTGCCCCCCGCAIFDRSRDDDPPIPYTVMQIANGLFTGGSASMLLGMFTKCEACSTSFFLVIGGRIAHLAAGICWAAADAALPAADEEHCSEEKRKHFEHQDTQETLSEQV